MKPARLILTALATLAALATGCDETASNPAPSPADATTGWLLASEPADPVGVAQAKATAKAGEPIVLHARIGGRAEAISDDSPVFTVMDTGVAYCGEVEEDNCATPWDYCCETPETIKANAATVQIVDAQGKPASSGPKAGGLAALDEVVLVGTVGPRPTPDVLTVHATGVYPVRSTRNEAAPAQP